jgi:hypothetical protein
MLSNPSADIESITDRMAKQRRIASWSYVMSGLLAVTGGVAIDF